MIITQESTEVKYNSFGWPIDPATGEAFTEADVRADQALLDLFPPGHIAKKMLRALSPDEQTAREANIERKRKARARRCARTGKRNLRASSVLSRPALSSAEQQATTRTGATAELVERVNGKEDKQTRTVLFTANGRTRVIELDIPFGGEPGTPGESVSASDEYGLQPPL